MNHVLSSLKTLGKATPIGSAVIKWRRIRDLRAWSQRDDKSMRFYSQFIGAGDIVFDVGANLGNRTKVFQKLASRVVAVEPQSQCMSVLRAVYPPATNVSLVKAACGSSETTARLRVSRGSTLSSLSEDWIRAVTNSRRFDPEQWGKTESCTVTTLDALIERFGVPAFIKIDVEGFELEVLKGLSRSVRAVSFEFTPELMKVMVSCIDRLVQLGLTQFNLSVGESFELRTEQWLDRDAFVVLLETYRGDSVMFGDVYARTTPATQ
jgi:FkbM family methyltransferase